MTSAPLALPSPDRCEACGGPSSVVDVRLRGGGRRSGGRSGWLRRRRECTQCGARWSTWESTILHPVRLRRYLETQIADPHAMLLSLIDPVLSRPSPSAGE